MTNRLRMTHPQKIAKILQTGYLQYKIRGISTKTNKMKYIEGGKV